MKTRFLISTAVGLVCATAAFAQSPSSTTTTPSTQPTQTPSTSSPATQKSPDTTNTQSPATSTSSGTSTGSPHAQTTAPSSPSGPSASQPAQAQTNNPAPATGQAQAPASGTANTAAQPSTPTSNTAQTPSTSNTAQSPSTNVNASVNINDQQRTRVTESISRLNVQPISNVNFSLTVGTAVPRDIRLQTVPADVAEIVPQYRGYSFFMVRDEIVIVEPSTYQIVTVLPRSGGSTAAAPARSKVSFTDKDRDVVRRHVKTRTTERQTTGSSAKTVIRRGERLPENVEVEEFPDVVYREAPSLREYRYIQRENRTYLVDPRERMVIEEID